MPTHRRWYRIGNVLIHAALLGLPFGAVANDALIVHEQQSMMDWYAKKHPGKVLFREIKDGANISWTRRLMGDKAGYVLFRDDARSAVDEEAEKEIKATFPEGRE